MTLYTFDACARCLTEIGRSVQEQSVTRTASWRDGLIAERWEDFDDYGMRLQLGLNTPSAIMPTVVDGELPCGVLARGAAYPAGGPPWPTSRETQAVERSVSAEHGMRPPRLSTSSTRRSSFSVFVSNDGTNDTVGGSVAMASTTGLALNNLKVDSAFNAAAAVAAFSTAVGTLGTAQGSVGALENRLQSPSASPARRWSIPRERKGESATRTSRRHRPTRRSTTS